MNTIQIEAKLKRNSFELNASLEIPGQGVTVILGPSGSGKTTLLRLLAGLEKPQQGFIRKAGDVWLDTSNKTFIPAQKRNVGVVFQDYALFEHMTVEANVAFGIEGSKKNKAVSQWLEKMNIRELAQRYPRQLSGGQRQRVALARALITEPDLLLLDEPFSALDAHLRQNLREQLLEVVSHLKQPVMMVTHDLNEARYLADHIGIMINGVVQRLDTTSKVFDDPGILDVARVLGWRNFLPITRIESHRLMGAWGCLTLEKEPSINTDWLTIRPEHIRIHNEANGIEAELIRVTEMDGYKVLHCQLLDGTSVYLQRPWNELIPMTGSRLQLELPEQHIRLLQECSTYHSHQSVTEQDSKNYSNVIKQHVRNIPRQINKTA